MFRSLSNVIDCERFPHFSLCVEFRQHFDIEIEIMFFFVLPNIHANQIACTIHLHEYYFDVFGCNKNHFLI